MPRVAGWCYDHRRIVLAVWLVAVAALIGTATSFGSHFSDNYASASLPSQRAQDLLSARFPAEAGATVDIVLHSGQPLTSAQNAASIARLASAVQPLPHVSAVSSPLAPAGQRQLSAGSRTGFVVVHFNTTDANLPGSTTRAVIRTALWFARPGLQVAVGGTPAENVVTAAPCSS